MAVPNFHIASISRARIAWEESKHSKEDSSSEQGASSAMPRRSAPTDLPGASRLLRPHESYILPYRRAGPHSAVSLQSPARALLAPN
jgi:hypothetical protein